MNRAFSKAAMQEADADKASAPAEQLHGGRRGPNTALG